MSVRVRFDHHRGDFHLQVDLELPGRGLTAIQGPSGAGKTTLLRAIAGLERDPSGRCEVLGQTWQDADGFMPPHQRPLGFVFQDSSLFPHLSARRNLTFGFQRVPEDRRRVGLPDVVDLLGLGRLLDRDPDTLSGGERQRIAIGRALLTSPRLLLMDEPMASLDRQGKRDILPYLDRLHRELEIPVLLVSHAPEEIARLADYLVVMDAGRLHAEGPAAELLTRLDLARECGDAAEAMVEARVEGFDEDFGLARLDFGDGVFLVARDALRPGQAARLRVLARDVSLTLGRQEGTSILNIFEGVVEAVAAEDEAQVLVRLRVGQTPLLSRVTRKSADQLGLSPGRQVWAQVKAAALAD